MTPDPTPTPAARLTPAACAGARAPFPVIVGCPRSGTSLLAVMLDAHPALAMPPETAFLKHVVSLPARPDAAKRFIDIVTADRSPISNWSDFGLDANDFAARIAALAPFSVAAATRAFYDLYAASECKPRAGEKTPDNIFAMREIATVLPEAHFIHVLRDPRDTALSWRKTWFAPSQDFHVLGQAWRYHVDAGRRAGASLARYVEVRYEDLVQNPADALARLCEFLALPFVPAMTDPSARGVARIARLQGRQHVSGRMVSRDDRTRIHANLARPPLPERVGVWRREMSAADRAAVERGAGALLAELGYAAAEAAR